MRTVCRLRLHTRLTRSPLPSPRTIRYAQPRLRRMKSTNTLCKRLRCMNSENACSTQSGQSQQQSQSSRHRPQHRFPGAEPPHHGTALLGSFALQYLAAANAGPGRPPACSSHRTSPRDSRRSERREHHGFIVDQRVSGASAVSEFSASRLCLWNRKPQRSRTRRLANRVTPQRHHVSSARSSSPCLRRSL